MASSQGATLDSVIINIESDASKASNGISSLITQLTSLKSAISGGFNNISKLAKSLTELEPATKGLSDVATNLKSLDTISDNLQKLSAVETPSGLTYTITRLKELGEVSKDIGKTSKEVAKVTTMTEPLMSLSSIGKPLGLNALVKDLAGLKSLGGLDNTIEEVGKLPQMVEPLEKIGNIQVSRGLGSLVKNLDKIPDIMSKLGNTQTLENIGRVSQELVTHMQPLADMMSSISNGYSALSKMADTYGVSAKTITRYTKQQTSIFKVLGDSLKTVTRLFKDLRGGISNFGNAGIKGMEKLNSKLKQIMLSLIGTRTLFTMLRKAVSEYMQMDVELQKYTQNVWRAFGAQLAPAIEYAMYLFKQFVRVIYSVILALTGIDLIARANAKAMDAWGKSAKDTLGNLQKFDDLNVVEFPKDKSGGLEDSLIDLDAIDLTPFQKIIDWVKELRDKIKEAINTGEWINVGRVLGEGINEGLDYLLDKLPLIREKLLEVVRDFGQFLQGAIETVHWDDVGKLMSEAIKLAFDSITTFITSIRWEDVGNAMNKFFENFDAVGVVHSITTAFGKAIEAFYRTFLSLDWGKIAKKLGDTIVAFFSDLSKILDKIPWHAIGEKIREAIENIPWGDIWKSVVDSASELKDGLEKLLEGLTGVPVKDWQKLERAIVIIGIALATYSIVKSFKLLTSFMGDPKVLTFAATIYSIATIIEGIMRLFEDIPKMLEDPSFSNFLKILQDISIIALGIGGLIAIFTGAWIPLLIAGIALLVTSIVKLVVDNWDKIVDWAKKAWDKITGFFDKLGKKWDDFKEGIKKAISDWISDRIQDVKDGIKNVIDAIVKFFTEDIPNAWKKFTNWISEKWDNFKKKLDEKVGNIKDKIIDTLVETIAKVKDKVRTIKEKLEKVGTWIYNHTIKPVVDKFEEMKNKLGKIFDKIKEKLTDTKNTIKNGFTGFANFILDKLESLINKIINGVNSMIKKLNKIKIDVPEGVPGIGGTTFGFNINTLEEVKLPRLAKGTNEIEAEGIYHLHPGEAVVPKQYNPALGGGTNRETNERLDTLIGILNNMNFTNVVNIGNEKIYEQQQNFNKFQQNKYGTIDLY